MYSIKDKVMSYTYQHFIMVFDKFRLHFFACFSSIRKSKSWKEVVCSLRYSQEGEKYSKTPLQILFLSGRWHRNNDNYFMLDPLSRHKSKTPMFLEFSISPFFFLGQNSKNALSLVIWNWAVGIWNWEWLFEIGNSYLKLGWVI